MDYKALLFLGMGMLFAVFLHIPSYAAINEPLGAATEQISPSDWVSESEILVYPDRIVLDVQDAYWARLTDTNSMDPVFDAGSNVLQKKPELADLQVGDIVSYRKGDAIIIHRIVEIGNDGAWYAITKGDNNSVADPDKVRFDQIERVVIGVIY